MSTERLETKHVCTNGHHWISSGVPELLIRWVIQCSLCGEYNIEEMNRYTLDLDHDTDMHRIRVDDATVERVARALMNSQLERHGVGPQTVTLSSLPSRVDARAVLTELTGKTFSALHWRNRTP